MAGFGHPLIKPRKLWRLTFRKKKVGPCENFPLYMVLYTSSIVVLGPLLEFQCCIYWGLEGRWVPLVRRQANQAPSLFYGRISWEWTVYKACRVDAYTRFDRSAWYWCVHDDVLYVAPEYLSVFPIGQLLVETGTVVGRTPKTIRLLEESGAISKCRICNCYINVCV